MLMLIRRLFQFSTNYEKHKHPKLSLIKDIFIHLLIMFALFCIMASAGSIEQNFALSTAFNYLITGIIIFAVIERANRTNQS